MYEKLKERRIKKHYTINDLAKVIDKSPAMYFKKEMGANKFSVGEAIKIAKFLKVKVEDIFLADEFQKVEIKGSESNVTTSSIYNH